ncbi:23S rRNA (adenine(2030)-N(6))-methyltransferase RlmJ [Fontimonas sp. SYSU GA230001]|uniref:23S rRNA (adenine(2030)-N(6))-methyltransferase RlmJ n=1 Tax=Fontimonas sp. SYSU GA230001 TaxID=3142450 RepID=UPI0032B440E9
MHYQHRYHAGNFADVFKHALLVELLSALNAKDAPWCYVETHGGAGLYPLDDAGAQRTGEARDGIVRVGDAATAPPPLQPYLQLVRRANDGGAIRHYPGSPLFALMLARPQDRVIVCEKVTAVAAELRALLAGDARAAVHVRDGYESASLLPPKERRGLVFVDPPFERPDEFDAAADFLASALKRFGNGVYALWYPYKNRYQTERWLRRLRSGLTHEALNLQIDTGAPSEGQMHACGLLVVHPPYAFAQNAPAVAAALRPLLALSERARTTCEHWPGK